MRKLTKHISNIARPTKRLRLTTWDNLKTPGKTAGVSELATEVLSRMLKTLERSVKAGEDLEPSFGAPKKVHAISLKGKKKKGEKKGKKDDDEKRSRSPQDVNGVDIDTASGEPEEENQQDTVEVTGEDFDKLETALETARDSVLAADCCIALLGSDRLEKQVGRLSLYS